MRREVLLSVQKALWGMIYPSIRAIAIGVEKEQKLKVIYYLDREPDQDDYDNISEVTSEVIADINFAKVEEVCIFSKKPFSELDSLDSWVYMRKEAQEKHITRIVFESWETGMRKISFTKLLTDKAGLSLSEAKSIKDRLVDNNETVEIEIEDQNLAVEIMKEAQNLGVKCRVK